MANYRENNLFSSANTRNNPFDDDGFEEIKSAEISRIQHEKQMYEKRMVDSSQRSLRLIEESKDVACKTEEELGRQEESLLRTESTLDKINSDLGIANRQITSLKSIWGTIGNYFRKPAEPKKLEPPKKPESEMTKDKAYNYQQPSGSTKLGWEEKKDVHSSHTSEACAQVDKNLDSMMSGLSELKGHALLMGETLDRHDDIIDRVAYKATAVNTKVENSDKEIKKILRK